MQVLNEWLTLAANLGVIIGIAFLALEIRQYEKQLASQSRFNYYNSRLRQIETLSTDPLLLPIGDKYANGIELTTEENYRLRLWSNAVLTGWEYEVGEYNNGRLSLGDLDIPGKKHAYNLPIMAIKQTYLLRKEQRETSQLIEFMEQHIVNN